MVIFKQIYTDAHTLMNKHAKYNYTYIYIYIYIYTRTNWGTQKIKYIIHVSIYTGVCRFVHHHHRSPVVIRRWEDFSTTWPFFRRRGQVWEVGMPMLPSEAIFAHLSLVAAPWGGFCLFRCMCVRAWHFPIHLFVTIWWVTRLERFLRLKPQELSPVIGGVLHRPPLLLQAPHCRNFVEWQHVLFGTSTAHSCRTKAAAGGCILVHDAYAL